MGSSKLKVIVLGAGFGGLEVSTILSEKLGDKLDLKIIDRNDSFFFGFSKLDVMFGHADAGNVRLPYHNIRKPGVSFVKDTIVAIDPLKKAVFTENGKYQADFIVIALGADYNIDATPGLSDGGNEFYSFHGAERIRDALPKISKGEIIVGVCSAPFKCPPAPSEAALMLHDYLEGQGVRSDCRISLVVPFDLPLPPSYGTSKALLKAFDERGINYIPEMMVFSIDPGRKVAVLDDGTELPFDLFLGIPEHMVPRVLEESGMLFDEWIPVNKSNFKTSYEGVYALGDCTHSGTPKAGFYAEKQAGAVAESIYCEYMGKEFSKPFDGRSFCYVEFGGGKVARADVDFYSGPSPVGVHYEASAKISREKRAYQTNRISRWFGLP
jgi:sulfide:quinone oxidoreductase